jgi:hypothetical protein
MRLFKCYMCFLIGSVNVAFADVCIECVTLFNFAVG